MLMENLFIVVAYVFLACITYVLLKKESLFEHIWFSFLWPITAILYLIHYIRNV